MAPKIILIADAHDDSRIVYSTFLHHTGFIVIEARNGAEALELVPKHMPQAVVTEVALPVISGLEVLRRLKRHPATGQIPILIVTTDVRAEVRRQAEEEGCDAFLLKPCPPPALAVALVDAMARLEIPAART